MTALPAFSSPDWQISSRPRLNALSLSNTLCRLGSLYWGVIPTAETVIRRYITARVVTSTASDRTIPRSRRAGSGPNSPRTAVTRAPNGLGQAIRATRPTTICGPQFADLVLGDRCSRSVFGNTEYLHTLLIELRQRCWNFVLRKAERGSCLSTESHGDEAFGAKHTSVCCPWHRQVLASVHLNHIH